MWLTDCVQPSTQSVPNNTSRYPAICASSISGVRITNMRASTCQTFKEKRWIQSWCDRWMVLSNKVVMRLVAWLVVILIALRATVYTMSCIIVLCTPSVRTGMVERRLTSSVGKYLHTGSPMGQCHPGVLEYSTVINPHTVGYLTIPRDRIKWV